MFYWLIACVTIVALFIVVIFFGEVYWTYFYLRSLSHAEKSEWFANRTRLYHMQPSNTKTEFVNGQEFAEAIDHSLRYLPTFSHSYKGMTVQNGLPAASVTTVILHINAGYGGMSPHSPMLTRLLWRMRPSTPIHDLTSRYGLLNLPCPIIGFTMPEGACINFGQEYDCLAIENVVRFLKHRNPQVKIIMSGECLGSIRIQRWLQHTSIPMDNIQVMLTCPINNMYTIMGPFYKWARIVMPNFKPESKLASPPLFITGIVFIHLADNVCGEKELVQVQERFPLCKIIVIPKDATDQRGRLVKHGVAFRWSQYKQHILEFLSGKQVYNFVNY